MLVRKLKSRSYAWLMASLPLASLPLAEAAAQTPNDPRETGGQGEISLMVGEYTLNFYSWYDDLSAETATGLVDTFFEVVEPVSEFYDPYTIKDIDIVVENPVQCGQRDDEEPPPACADAYGDQPGRGFIRIHGPDIKANPRDFDVVTHEITHVFQHYNWAALNACNYWYEGEADYARDRWGKNLNGWKLPEPVAGKTYKDGYGYTAAFLKWLEQTWDAGTILLIHDYLLSEMCPPNDVIADLTGYPTLDDLYKLYASGGKPTAPTPIW
jgi:hypothetical protein